MEEKTYTTKQACKKIGVSRHTIIKWFKFGHIKEVQKDRFNYRIFTAIDIKKIKKFKEKNYYKRGE
ncbi:MAG: MerR family transcriptional regulator [Candidatus Firestonebacteria bacterium]